MTSVRKFLTWLLMRVYGIDRSNHLEKVKDPYVRDVIDEEELEERLEYKLRQQRDVYYYDEDD